MINIMELLDNPKDHDSMVTRKSSIQTGRINGIVVNKKSQQGYSVNFILDTDELTPKTMCKVNCTCADFKFRWAYVLSKQDALINPTNFILTPPKVTNPSEKLKACKHIHKFAADELAHKLRLMSSKKNTI